MSAAEFYQIAPSALVDYWRVVEPMIAAACARGANRFRPADICRRAAEGSLQIWMVWDTLQERVAAVVVTELLTYPEFRAARIVLLTGQERADWRHFEEALAEWARANGCQVLEALARPGWERELKGWRKSHVLLERRLA